jgi:hypothetical protein
MSQLPADVSCRVRPETICGILSQENQYKVIKSHHIHKANMPAYCSRYVHQQGCFVLVAVYDSIRQPSCSVTYVIPANARQSTARRPSRPDIS